MNSEQHILKLHNLNCPIPVLKTYAKLKTLSSGEQLKIECTDPLTQNDIPSLCRAKGYRLIHQEELNGLYHFWIEVP